MIPRAVRQTQAAGSALSFRSSTSSSLRSASTFASRSRTSGALKPLSQSIKPFPPRLAQRYYSSEKEANGGNGAAETAENGKDATQKELEAKSKEIVELKVCLAGFLFFIWGSVELENFRFCRKAGANH